MRKGEPITSLGLAGRRHNVCCQPERLIAPVGAIEQSEQVAHAQLATGPVGLLLDDPREFDLLHDILTHLHRPDALIDVVCGYRTQETNDMLRESGTTNAALHSQHIEAKALDLRVPGVSAMMLRNAALSLSAGGVRVLGDGKAQRNVHGERIAFVHPKDFLGALVELEEHKI